MVPLWYHTVFHFFHVSNFFHFRFFNFSIFPCLFHFPIFHVVFIRLAVFNSKKLVRRLEQQLQHELSHELIRFQKKNIVHPDGNAPSTTGVRGVEWGSDLGVQCLRPPILDIAENSMHQGLQSGFRQS